MRLGGYEVVLRPVAGSRAVRPVTADTIPPPEPQPGRVDQLRQAARTRTGLDLRKRRALLGAAATAKPSTAGPAVQAAPSQPLVGRNTFAGSGAGPAKGGGRSNEESNELSNEVSHDDENAGDRSGCHTPSGHVNGGEEDR
jgi:hypothetical protein